MSSTMTTTQTRRPTVTTTTLSYPMAAACVACPQCGFDRPPVDAAPAALLDAQKVDFTLCFRTLSSSLRGDDAPARSLFGEPSAFDEWAARWRAQLSTQTGDPQAIAAAMDRVNPVYIPRNHLVEEALTAATLGDLDPLARLLEAVTRPYDERPGLERYAAGAPEDFGRYRTFCGT